MAKGQRIFVPAEDLPLLSSIPIQKSEVSEKGRIAYLFHDKSGFIKYNPVSLLLGGLMYGYQRFVSPQLATECPYEISCSHFSTLLIREYGLFKGILLSADRLMRCNRMAASDVSPMRFEKGKEKIVEYPDIYRWHP